MEWFLFIFIPYMFQHSNRPPENRVNLTNQTRKLAAIPNLKLMLIFCDPIGRLEKGFMHHHLCYKDLDEAQQRGYASTYRDGSEQCFTSTSALLSERTSKLKSYWQSREVAVHMPAVVNLFAGRMMVATSLTVFVFQFGSKVHTN